MSDTLQQSEKCRPPWSTRHRVLTAILCAAILFTLGTLFLRSYFALKAQTASRLHKLEGMLVDLKNLSPRISSFEDAMRIGQRNNMNESTKLKPCTRDQCMLEIHISWSDDRGLATTLLGHHLLSQLGIHVWEAWGWIVIEKNIVTSVGAQIAVEDPESRHRWHEATWTLFQEIPRVDEGEEKQFLRNFDPSHDASPDFLVNWTNFPYADRLESLDARLSVRATQGQRHAAEDFNLKCLTSKGDCSNVCDLLPGAARLYNERLRAGGWLSQGPQCGQ